MTSVLRIAHLRIAHQGAILRWAILRVIDTSNRTSEPQTLRVDLLNLKIYILAAQIGGPVM